ncbi:hypothetical protein [Mucilaginibacter sp. dw_454]|uniref:hypothetical protein n=1 Tax=Mucilaginibacter sp. dw_454 TaxID=2720079 RepID=UPI001BD445D2|nr:hypothetical protein [Mucilaginibacter sp. dw_454]
MLSSEDKSQDEKDSGAEQGQPNTYRVDDENSKEKELTPYDDTRPVREGQPMGGQNFGSNNVTSSGDDKNNPSQNAGYSNAYFKRTEPAEEHTESNNFKPGEKQVYNEGTADNDGESHDKPNIPGPGELPDQQKVGE